MIENNLIIMRKYKYIGLFKSWDNHSYELEVSCHSFLQALFLLTADAIREGKHYQLYSITDEKNKIVLIDDILKCSILFKN